MLVILRDRAIARKNILQNQIKNLSRIEYVIPECLDKDIVELKKLIRSYEDQMRDLLENGDYPIYDRLIKVKGISHATIAKLVAYIDISKSETASQLRRYCGLDPNYNKRRNGMSEKEAKKCGVPYLKKELVGVLAGNFIKMRMPVYRDFYDAEKAKEMALVDKYGANVKVPGTEKKTTVSTETKTEGGKQVNNHAHNRAKLHMMQLFMEHYYDVARTVHGLPKCEPYVDEKLHHNGIIKPDW